jgi:hypothetical protein
MITHDELTQMLHYDPETGIFTWRISRGSVKAGRVAGTSHNRGYRQIIINKRLYLVHRLAWFYVHGEWPPNDVDHINHVRADNRISNLRLATHSQNQANMHTRRRGVGLKGVSWDKERRMWLAQLFAMGKRRLAARFKTEEEAHTAYMEAARLHFGEFACIGGDKAPI